MLKKTPSSSVQWGVVAALLVQTLFINFVMSDQAINFEDQKCNYCNPTPDPNASPPPSPTVSYTPPAHGSYNPPSYGSYTPPAHGSYNPPSQGSYTPPAHGSYTPPSQGSYTPPAHGSYNPPSHGSGSGGRSRPSTPYHGTPPANCGNPPARGSGSHHRHRHRTPSSPGGSGGGGYYRSPPTTPTTPTPVVVSPPSGSGGYYRSPPTTPTTPTPVVVTPPTTPTTPTPVVVSPPSIITPPTTPGITNPSPPFSFDPNSPPFTCTYWRNNPTLIWGIVGWWGTIGSAFGLASLPGIGSNTNLLQALSNTRTDGLGELYREGTAAFLNSMVDPSRFPYSTTQVRDSFVASLGSTKAAMDQARLFKLANEGRFH